MSSTDEYMQSRSCVVILCCHPLARIYDGSIRVSVFQTLKLFKNFENPFGIVPCLSPCGPIEDHCGENKALGNIAKVRGIENSKSPSCIHTQADKFTTKMDLDLINDIEEVFEQQLGSHVEHLSNKKPSVKKVISHFEAMSDSGETSSANSMGRPKQIATKSSAGTEDALKLRSSSKSPSDSFLDCLHQMGLNVLSTSNSPRDKVKIVKRRRRGSRGPTTCKPLNKPCNLCLSKASTIANIQRNKLNFD